MSDIKEHSIQKHKELRGKLEIKPKGSVKNMRDLSVYYTPGVGAVSKHIHEHEDEARDYTSLNNTVAVISDGSAVLGLGDIGPKASLPVMEGKSMLFKEFADIDSFPIILDVHDVEGIVSAVKAIAPSFGGINLEDISAPKCFEIEERLKSELEIPVMHDDQHGTAVVVLAGLINAFKVTSHSFDKAKVVIVGAGAAGVAIAKLLSKYGTKTILMVDSVGIISKDRDDLSDVKKSLLDFTNKDNLTGGLEEALQGADVFIGVSKAGLLNQEMIKSMNKDPIIFAMANPDPEILPDEAHKAGASVVATGRSDFPNQVNNAVAFPGIFRGALDNHVRHITDEHKISAAEVIAGLVKDPSPTNIIPDVFDKRLVPEIAKKIV